MFEPVTKWNTRVERVEAIPEIVRKAFRVATLEKPGPDPHRAAREPRRDAPVDDDDRGRWRPARTYFPEPTDEAIDHAADLIADVGAADRPRRQRRAPAARLAGAAGLRPRPPRPGRGDVHGQGRDRRSVAPLADGGRAPGPRPRPDRLRPGRPRRSASATTSSSTRRPRWNPDGRKRIVHIDTQPAEVDAPVPARGRADRRHRRLAPAAARRGPAARDQRPRRRRSATRPARPSSTPTSGTRSSRTSHAGARATGLPDQARSGRSPTSRAALGPDDIVVSATSAPTRSGSLASTRPTSRTR